MLMLALGLGLVRGWLGLEVALGADLGLRLG